jgi:hypothetical protein
MVLSKGPGIGVDTLGGLREAGFSPQPCIMAVQSLTQFPVIIQISRVILCQAELLELCYC